MAAMRLPRACDVPVDLSLVNTFRVVFDCLAIERVELLENRSWIENFGAYNLREVDPPTGLLAISTDS